MGRLFRWCPLLLAFPNAFFSVAGPIPLQLPALFEFGHKNIPALRRIDMYFQHVTPERTRAELGSADGRCDAPVNQFLVLLQVEREGHVALRAAMSLTVPRARQ